MAEGEEKTGRVVDKFDCPDCGEAVAVAAFDDGRALVHPSPPCITFEKLTAEQYAEIVRRHYTKS